MSVKFQRETVRTASEGAAAAGVKLPTGKKAAGKSGEHPIAEAVGTALTGGEKSAGTKGYLGVGFTILVALFVYRGKAGERHDRNGEADTGV